ncbi:ATP-binding protein [Treponema primitia]|uniref:ATP-binding protein n=1 Tax=Treponema primitia TaxID=88058 RepID=UPI00025551D2|nr:ATP-binding protein [Treponema primitia]
MGGLEIKIDNFSPLFDKSNMEYKEFSSDFSQIRLYTMWLVRSAPSEIREFNLLEQQISEIIKNAIKHGNKNNIDKKVKIWYSLTAETAHLIVEDEGEGFKDLEKWNAFNRKRLQYIGEQNFDDLGKYVSFRGADSDNYDGGNALFAALEYWNGGFVFNEKRNAVGMKKFFNSKSSSTEEVLSDIKPW